MKRSATLWLIAPLLALTSAFGAVKVGDPAPPIILDSLLAGRTPESVTLEALKGKAIVIEFWATWCGPCVDAIPHLNELVDKFAGRPIEFLSVTAENAAVVEPFLKSRPIHGLVGFDRGQQMMKVYEFDGIPDTVLIDANGRVAAIVHPAVLKEEHLEDLLAGRPVKARPIGGPTMNIDRSGLESTVPALLDIIVRPAATGSNGGVNAGPGKRQWHATPLRELFSGAYGVPSLFVEGDAVADTTTRYDVSMVGPRTEDEALRKLLPDLVAAAFHVTVKRETRDTEGWVLTAPKGRPEGLQEAAGRGGSSQSGGGTFKMTGMAMAQMVRMMQYVLARPVADKTGLEGRYDLALSYEEARPESLVDAMRAAGFGVERATLPTEFLMVSKK
jgi:uncharacterized protein (TIGR03435 family)